MSAYRAFRGHNGNLVIELRIKEVTFPSEGSKVPYRHMFITGSGCSYTATSSGMQIFKRSRGASYTRYIDILLK